MAKLRDCACKALLNVPISASKQKTFAIRDLTFTVRTGPSSLKFKLSAGIRLGLNKAKPVSPAPGAEPSTFPCPLPRGLSTSPGPSMWMGPCILSTII